MPTKGTRRRYLTTITSIDGHIVPPARALISVEDWGFRYGWGAFETIRVVKGKPVFIERHLRRFAETAQALLLAANNGMDWWRREIVKVLGSGGASDRVLNLYWTRGEAPAFKGRRIICLRPLQPRHQQYSRVWLAPWPMAPGCPGVGAKTLAYLPYTYSSICAQAAGFSDAILLSRNGRIVDGASASLFIIENGRLYTPRLVDGALPGVTRSVVFEIARELKIPAREVSLSTQRLYTADGAFLCSVLRGLRAVRQVDDRKLSVSSRAKRTLGFLKRAYLQRISNDIRGYA